MEELRFVNRERERATIANSAHRLMLIDAPAGYGKSRLLRCVKDDYEKMGWKCALIDFREIPSTEAFRKELCLAVGFNVNEDRASALRSDWAWKSHLAVTGGKLLLLVDSISENPELVDADYENPDNRLLNWFLGDFVPSCMESLPPTSFRVVVAGRYLGLRKFQERHFQQFLPIELGDFTESVIQELLQDAVAKFPPTNWTFKEGDYVAWTKLLTSLSGQHPGIIVNLIRHVFAGKWVLPTRPEEKSQIVKGFVKQQLDKIKETLDNETCIVLDYIFVFRRFNVAAIDALKIDGYVPRELDSRRVLTQLARHGLIWKPPASIFYSDRLVRNLFLIQFRLLDTETYVKLNHIAQNMYYRFLEHYSEKVTSDDLFPDDFVDVCICESLYHCFQIHLYSPNSIDPAKDCLEKHSIMLERLLGLSPHDPGRRKRLRALLLSDPEIHESLKIADLWFGKLLDSSPDFSIEGASGIPASAKYDLNPTGIEELTAEQRKGFQKAFGNAYDSTEISHLLAHEMDIALENILVTRGESKIVIVENVVEYCRKEGRLLELVTAAYRTRPRNPGLLEFVRRYFPKLLDDQNLQQT